MKVVIIGGVAGGATAAARLRRLDEEAEIVILERGEYISYANCGLPYYIGDVIKEKESLTLQTPKKFYERFRIQVKIKHEATAIHPDTKTITVKNLEDGTIYEENYDKLILSPGAEPVKIPLEGVEDKRIFSLRNIPDTFAIKEFIETKKPKRAVVVGGGYIGVEMAENLSHGGMEVTIVEFTKHVIGPLDEDLACDVHRYLKSKGIHLELGNGVKAFHPKEEEIEVELSEGILKADMVLLSVGVRPDTALAKEASLRVNERGAIIVNEFMQTSNPHIYGLGDAVQIQNYVTKAEGYIPLAGPANKQGRIAADHICGISKTYKGTQGSSILKVFDMTIAMTGIHEEEAIRQGLDYDSVCVFSSSHASYYPGASNMTIKIIFENKSGRLLGAQIVGFEGVDKRCDVLATAIRGGMTAFDLTELELCYAPPFSSAKDPVNMAGYVIENILTGKVKQVHWKDVQYMEIGKNNLLLDVRTKAEYEGGHIEGALHIPVDELRENLDKLDDKDKTVYVHCQSGLRSYIACRILNQKGYNCYNVDGGYRLYETMVYDKKFDGTLKHICGINV